MPKAVVPKVLPPEPAQPETVDATPTKRFFIDMITRDIDLQSCVLDLIDNSLDGATRTLDEGGKNKRKDFADQSYSPFWVHLTITKDRFVIKDNCGGIAVKTAKEVAFHFGRPPEAGPEKSPVIGAYGIGMKRAIFKLGTRIKVDSSTEKEGFAVEIDVPVWEKTNLWSFDLVHHDPDKTKGLEIAISTLRSSVSGEFSDQVFMNRLRTAIARDYAFFLAKGLGKP